MIRVFVDGLKASLNRMVVEEAMKMANGQCADFEDYMFKTGYVRGLRQAMAETEALMKRADPDEEAA